MLAELEKSGGNNAASVTPGSPAQKCGLNEWDVLRAAADGFVQEEHLAASGKKDPRGFAGFQEAFPQQRVPVALTLVEMGRNPVGLVTALNLERALVRLDDLMARADQLSSPATLEARDD